MRLKLISPLRPGLIQGEGDDFLYLIMPIRLRRLIVGARSSLAELPLLPPRSSSSSPPGFVLVTGPNGVGKTNLLEALHVGAPGLLAAARAPSSQLVRFGDDGGAGARLAGDEADAPVETEVTHRAGRGEAAAAERRRARERRGAARAALGARLRRPTGWRS